MKLALGPRGMKLSLIAMLAIGVSLSTGCAGSTQTAATTSSASSAVGTTMLTSAALASSHSSHSSHPSHPSHPSRPSSLAPAAWDGDEASPASAAPDRLAPVTAPVTARATWGTAAVVTSPSN